MIGSWKNFADKKEAAIRKFIEDCIDLGCNKFDTAFVYNNGLSERILGSYPELDIATKVPAKVKPISGESNMDVVYEQSWMDGCIKTSLDRLGHQPEILFLHNWCAHWQGEESAFLEFVRYKQKGCCKALGISLPNGYSGSISERVLLKIDWIMAPFNSTEHWIADNYQDILNNNVKIICRSLFAGGKDISKNKELELHNIRGIHFADRLLIGSSNMEHVKEILEHL